MPRRSPVDRVLPLPLARAIQLTGRKIFAGNYHGDPRERMETPARRNAARGRESFTSVVRIYYTGRANPRDSESPRETIDVPPALSLSLSLSAQFFFFVDELQGPIGSSFLSSFFFFFRRGRGLRLSGALICCVLLGRWCALSLKSVASPAITRRARVLDGGSPSRRRQSPLHPRARARR